ncbi:Lrp/AsnC family transcriptional regulator [Nocardia arthritidis]|uniref:Winged helix-turn-helix transcriptional regulator n=1 Tax=Nocardia arthritidis TaxID=228602 RepID=A0A6G9YD73_9NOCA|nr:Lrp/AsnC family transcriptional regulator [Nocardia arthritidis]QIS11006.1 winged helix-turn-helix transcriptional regulator [Nocardia arthritidis]
MPNNLVPAAELPLDDVDLDLVAALQLAPRAPVNVLAEVIGSSPSTITRRMTRLREENLLRVIGRLDWPLFATAYPRLVWLRCLPGQVHEVAARIAELPQVQTIIVTTGSADLYCSVYPLIGTDVLDLLTRRLPGLPGLVSVESQLVLRAEKVGHSWRLPRLTRAQETQLSAHGVRITEPRATRLSELGELELRAVELLAADGRVSAAEVARELDISRSAAYRLTQSLLESGTVSPRVEIEPAALGHRLEAIFALTAEPSAIPEILDRLGRHPSARLVAMVAGSASVVHTAVFRDEQELAEFITAELGGYPGITAVDTRIAVQVVRRYWMTRDGAYLGAPVPGFPTRLLRPA